MDVESMVKSIEAHRNKQPHLYHFSVRKEWCGVLLTGIVDVGGTEKSDEMEKALTKVIQRNMPDWEIKSVWAEILHP